MLEIKKVFRPYVMASVNNVERWLSAMSENGWTLYGVHRWVFTFRKSAPKHKEFLCTGPRIKVQRLSLIFSHRAKV